jgi:CelD/BcsL family acetyltransferase involved in cellulose biosynthesis
MTVLDPLADERWAALVERSPDASIFHHPAWLRLLRDTYRYELTACCVEDADGTLVAGLPIAAVSSRLTGRRLVALPFSDLCPPLVAPGAGPGTGRALAGALDTFRRRRAVALEVRGTGGVLEGAPPGDRFHHHLLELGPDVAAVERRFAKPQVARGVRRAEREGLTAERRTDAGALRAFYALHTGTRRRLGVPTQPRRFILAFEPLFARGLGFVLLVRRGDRPVAAAVFLTFHDVLTYKYGASDERFLSARPNNLLFMEAIRWGCANGMRTLDFGRTHWHQEGLRAFKLAWGAEERELRYRHVGGAVPGGRDARAERWLGAAIRRSPPVAGRLIGEVLYRHAG